MTGTECATGCDRPTRDTRLLCDHCAWQVERALAEMPALLDELTTTLTRQSRMGEQNGKSRSADHPVPFDVRASAVLDQIRVVLAGWSLVLIEDHQQDPPPDTLRGMARFLLARLDMIAMHEAASDIHSEITDATAAGWRAVDRVAERVFVGVCECGEWLYARPSSRLVECRGCARGYDVAESRDRLWQALDGQLMTIGEIVSWAVQLRWVEEREVKRMRNLLDQWVRRRRIVAHGVDRKGRATYPFGVTLTEALAATRGAIAVDA